MSAGAPMSGPSWLRFQRGLERVVFSEGAKAQALRFALAAGLSFGISISFPLIFTSVLHLAPEVGVAAALMIAFLVNFLTVRFFVFRSAAPVWPQFFAFSLSVGGFRLLEYLAFLLLYRMLHMHYVVALAGILWVSFALKFFFHRKFVFMK